MKTILITGASGGIGLSISKTLAKENNRLILIYNKHKKELSKNVNKIIDDENLRNEMSLKALTLKNESIDNLSKFILAQDNADYTNLLNQNIELSLVKKNVKQALKLANKSEKVNRRKHFKYKTVTN